MPITIPPGLLAKYPFVRVLGQGAFAAVYLADPPRLGRQVVVKVLGDAKADSVKRFEREAQLLARMRHPGVIELLEFGEVEGCRFLVEPFETEDTLQAVLARRGRLAWKEAARIALEMSQALEHVHGLGIVHRDLKPANVLMTSGGRPRLVDFGAAFVADAARLTATNASIGTPVYMAPEMIEAKPFSAAADLYGLGVLLYEMIAGENPFHSTDLREVIERQLYAPVESLPAVDPPVPASLEKLVVELLAKNPERRPEGAAAVSRRLSEILARPAPSRAGVSLRKIAAVRAEPAAGPPAADDPPAPADRRPVLAVAAVLVAGMIAVGGWALWKLAVPPRAQPAPPSPSRATSPPLELAAEEAVQAWSGSRGLPLLDGVFNEVLASPAARANVLFEERMAAHPLVRGLARLAAEPKLSELTERLAHRPQLVTTVLDAAAELSRAQLFANAQGLSMPPSLDLLQRFPGVAAPDNEPRSAMGTMIATGEIKLYSPELAFNDLLDHRPKWSRTVVLRPEPGRRVRLVSGVRRITSPHAYVRATFKVTRPADRAASQVANLFPLTGGKDREFISLDLRRELAEAHEIEVELEIALLPGRSGVGRIEVGPMELLAVPGP